MTGKREEKLTCTSCGVFNCYRRNKEFPDFCLSTVYAADSAVAVKLYQEGDNAKIAHVAAEIEALYFGKLTRVEEIIAFSKKIGVKKIGIATCIGLMDEAKTFARILAVKGLESYSVICKVGSVDKTEIGIPPELKGQKGCHESLCNPVLQAKILNKQQTDLNVIVGLCVGHDSLFIKYSDALVTTLITKDRLLGHNPAAALYTSSFYYKRLLEKED
jgi:uncharacterized metal-binding protein